MVRAEVYWNLHKQCWSLRDAKTKRVVVHSPDVCLRNVEFRVQPAGRAKVRATGRKNVHAYAVGEMCTYAEFHDDAILHGLDKVSYNPYRNETFIDSVGSTVRRANYASFEATRQVWATESRS